jgi:hypothetical protein
MMVSWNEWYLVINLSGVAVMGQFDQFLGGCQGVFALPPSDIQFGWGLRFAPTPGTLP